MKIHQTLSLALIAPLFADQSVAFWPLKSLGIDLGLLGQQQQPLVNEPVQRDKNVKQVAIIGAGAGGSSTAWYLRQFAEEEGLKLNITIYEKSSHVGGRSTTVNIYNDSQSPIELGASIFVKVNEILVNATAEFGLDIKSFRVGDLDEGILGIWNGEEFVFEQDEGDMSWWDMAKMFWKYGMAPLRTNKLMKDTVGKFLKLYEPPYFPFKSLTEHAETLGLLQITGVTGEQFLDQNNIKGAFPRDVIQASTRVNYAQNLGTIHGLEAMVCMAIDGAMQIDGGNWQIFQGMVNASGAHLNLETSVTGISKAADGSFALSTAGSETAAIYDTIVLAAPYQFTNIKLAEEVVPASALPDTIPYVKLHVTLFTSPLKLSAAFFNQAPGTTFPNTILTTLGPGESASDGAGRAGFFSISTLRTVVNPQTAAKEYAYKIFSPEAVDAAFLSRLFGVEISQDVLEGNGTVGQNEVVTWFYPHVFHSYPVELPRVTFEDAVLADNFYYTSGIESFISTMETSALSGRNVARLIADEYKALQSLEDVAKVEIVEVEEIAEGVNVTEVPGKEDL